jgi:reactive intermediate/imine deaminase
VKKTEVTTDDAPAPAHTFAQAVVKNGILQVSGQGPLDPATNEDVAPGDVRAQTTRTLQNVEAILTAAGSGLRDVMMLRVYLSRQEDFAAMNDAYGAFLSQRLGPDDVQPCRTTVTVGLPRPEMLVEIDALAVLD